MIKIFKISYRHEVNHLQKIYFFHDGPEIRIKNLKKEFAPSSYKKHTMTGLLDIQRRAKMIPKDPLG